jgi:ABC-type glutathione transport system ATPase component
MSDLLLEINDLCVKSHDRTLVDGVGFKVHAGKILALIGESGAGKSLTARHAMGVLDVNPGVARGHLRFPAKTGDRDWFDGVRGGGLRAQRRCTSETASLRGGYVTYSPQSASSALNPGRTIGRQLELAILRREKAPANMSEAVKRVLEEVGLPPRAALALPGELSGGQAQRAALAIAIAPDPRVMIADEPETGLDPVLRRVVTELMINVARKIGVGLVLISHNKDTVDRVADEVVIIGPDPWARHRTETA